MMFGIDAIVTEHFEMFFRDVNNKTLYEIQSRNSFGNIFIHFGKHNKDNIANRMKEAVK